MPAKTLAEKAKIKEALDAAKPTHDKMRALSAEEDAKWNKEIANLESRVYTEAVEIDLGNGTSIAIRTCLLGSEGERLDELEKAQKTEEDPVKRAAMAAEMIEIVTLNPLITKEWILENQDKYSPADVLRVLMGFMEVRVQERKDRIMRIYNASLFRPEPVGP